MNRLEELQKYGQSVWLDYIRRSLMTSGEFERLIKEDGLSGVTSNPTIFEKAIDGSTDYDQAIRALLGQEAHLDAQGLYEALAIEDIQMAADLLRPVYDQTQGGDGFASLEVSPQLAHDTAGTVAEARRLWHKVNRPNVMIKVPATDEGVPAIEILIAEGINVNVTLMFSLAHYEKVARAYLAGLEKHPEPRRVASVASLFVSRVDTVVDRALEAVRLPDALALQGKVATSNAKKLYMRFQDLFYGDGFAPLLERGARVQRLLWASTGTKNPAYPDVLYVEELIGKDTVNTMPPATLNAFRSHGQARASVEEVAEDALATLEHLKSFDIDLNAITAKLQEDGVAAFLDSFDKLRAGLERKRQALLTGAVDRQVLTLGTNERPWNQRLENFEKDDLARRLWRKDPTVWSSRPVPEITNRLGWLSLPEMMHEHVDELVEFASRVRSQGVRHVVLLGMGGSSLAPEVFMRTFGNAPNYPELIVLDSTHPKAVRAVGSRVNLRETLFLISSKSGTTTEPHSLFRYFWDRVSQVTRRPGACFAAITDPETPLVRLARTRGFMKVLQAPTDVGGRYSALSVFGLVPAALIGVNVHRVLDRAWAMAEACASCVRGSENPGLVLGAALGELALAGRDKVTFLASSSLAAFPDWLEQLIAESTGKDGGGIVPVASEPVGPPDVYGSDRLFARLSLEGEREPALEEQFSKLNAAGHPVIRIELAEKADLGQEFFRWEFAVAVAGAIMGIHPFNQPDVELAKELAQQAMKKAAGRPSGAAAPVETTPVSSSEELKKALEAWLSSIRPGDYVGVQAYLAPTAETADALTQLRLRLRGRLHVATTLGFGPRFLHSTGQLHKGGPNSGAFLQLVDAPGTEDLPVPATDYTFGKLIRAQAVGDYLALRKRGRRVLRIDLGKNPAAGLRELEEALGA